MNIRFLFILTVVLFVTLALGCSGSGVDRNPLAPSTPPTPDPTSPNDLTANADVTSDCDCGHRLWGFWQGAIDPDTGEVELVSVRDILFHVNIVGYLQAPMPPGLDAQINNFNQDEGLVDIDLTITHPFANSNLRGFDVRGILMGAGEAYASQVDPTITFPKPNAFRVLNADGYSRWWNAPEFSSGGLYGFVPGDLGLKTYIPQSTVNGYKYFADVLEATDPVVPAVNPANRGTFSTDGMPPEATRNYQLQFPLNGQGKPIWMFQYAMDASWAPATGSAPPPKPVDEYPIEANSPEAFHIEVDTHGTTAWYETDTSMGGDIVLQIEVFDWAASVNPDGITGEVESITIESPTLFAAPVSVPLTPSAGSQTTSGIYTVSVPNVHPSALTDQEVLIHVNSAVVTTYAPPISGPSYPTEAALAAFQVVNIPISDEPPIPAVLTVVSPNGGESLEAAGLWEITWTSFGPVGDTVKIEYSQSNEFYTEITPGTENDGSFMWNPVADIEDDEVRIVVTSTASPIIFDQSDEFFEISPTPAPQITVTSPNGGEAYFPDGSTDITWTTSGAIIPTVSIGYTVSDGPETLIAAGEMNDGTFDWTPIPDINSEEVRIVVTDELNPLVTDTSDEFFTVYPPTLMITDPNGGEIWTPGMVELITWESFGNTGFEVSISYTISDGLATVLVPFTDNDGEFLLSPVPDVESDEVRIIITSVDFPTISDSSDEFFSITIDPDPTIIVTQPNGGEEWIVGESAEITWESYGLVGFEVRIDYMIDGDPAVNIIAMTNNDGSFDWDPIPDINSDFVKIIVYSILNPLVNDESDDFFMIHGDTWIDITSPNGGEILTGVGTHEITWTSSGAITDVDIWFSSVDGDGYPHPISMFAPNTGSFMWDPVDNLNTTEGRLWIYSSTQTDIEDFSDDYFSIFGVPQELELVTPNGGEVWNIGGSETIEWTSVNLWGNIDIIYTTADGEDPIEIASDIPDTGSFTWDDIPAPPTDTARVRITSDYYPTLTDVSDDYFTLAEVASLTLTSPNGGETLDAEGTWQVTWDSTGSIANVNLLLSTDSGGIYDTDIAPGVENNGSYLWSPVANIDSTTCRIKIENADNTDIYDESDADFSIVIGGPTTGWIPKVGQVQVPFPDVIPDQGTEPPDISVFSDGAVGDSSRGLICTQTDTSDITFSLYDDAYSSPVLLDWTYPNFAIPIHKFDVATNGLYAFVVNANPESFPNETVNDPFYCAFNAVSVADGTSASGSWHLYGDTGDPDPDAAPWRRVVDVSSGVTGGIDDSTFFYLTVIADHPDQPQPHDGNILISLWFEPYSTDIEGFDNRLVPLSTQGGGDGYVDDTNPASMAFAVDDDSGLAFDDDAAPAYWVLGSDGRITSILLAPASGSYFTIPDQLGADQFGTAIPVDIECAPAKEFDYSVSDPNPFNWICVLLDNGDGTWSVGVWECDFLADPIVYHLIDITAPITGTPMALDVDGTDFEIHVVSENAGVLQTTVFEYIPE